ncbi:uncharacterized protein SPSC_00789 [Sporisorium scitamineum]|uniref:GST N-terminal domain-containing protein n=1 Tax=Sporisorium scitamineum TaxID=49012 RepID=A0A0F7RTY1_9BASI|nr:hypothetical protein [Sporisorium scitamineum]CDU22159.1 uncharacterized protein SPSC_00789 [Sporisorium scitamineum]
MSDVPKATLYTFDGSVWASAPRLALVEKGYSASDVDLKIVNLVKAENFDPSYLRINSKGTVPTLVVPLFETTSAEVATKFRAINDTKAILEFLDKSRTQNTLPADSDAATAPAPILAPATIEGKAVSDEIIALVHDASVDPNFLLLGARNEAEFDQGKSGLPGTFVTNRYNALVQHQKSLSEGSATVAFDGSANPKSSAIHENLKKWYADKLESQSLLTKAYVQNDTQAIQQLIQMTNATWKAVGETLATLEAKVQGPFALGDQLSLADLHVVPWLARIAAIAGGLQQHQGEAGPLDQVDGVLAGVDGKVGDKIRALWTAFSERPSFKTVYGDGLH